MRRTERERRRRRRERERVCCSGSLSLVCVMDVGVEEASIYTQNKIKKC